jgi:hypothetical protein
LRPICNTHEMHGGRCRRLGKTSDGA